MKTLFSLGVILLAGGTAKRFGASEASVPKLLEDIHGTPVLGHILNAIDGMKGTTMIASTVAIISEKYKAQLRAFFRPRGVQTAVQKQHLGTADAIWRSIEQGVYPSKSDYVVILMGDQPLIPPAVISDFSRAFVASKKNAGILSFRETRTNPIFKKCGVIQFHDTGVFEAIRSDTPPRQEKELLHAGPYIFKTSWLEKFLRDSAPKCIGRSTSDGEFHLYEALQMARHVFVYECRNSAFCIGVDTPKQLAEARTQHSRSQTK